MSFSTFQRPPPLEAIGDVLAAISELLNWLDMPWSPTPDSQATATTSFAPDSSPTDVVPSTSSDDAAPMQQPATTPPPQTSSPNSQPVRIKLEVTKPRDPRRPRLWKRRPCRHASSTLPSSSSSSAVRSRVRPRPDDRSEIEAFDFFTDLLGRLRRVERSKAMHQKLAKRKDMLRHVHGSLLNKLYSYINLTALGIKRMRQSAVERKTSPLSTFSSSMTDVLTEAEKMRPEERETLEDSSEYLDVLNKFSGLLRGMEDDEMDT